MPTDRHHHGQPESPPPQRGVLVIDDDPGDAILLHRMLERVPHLTIDFVHETDPDVAMPRLDEQPFDLVFLDYLLQYQTGVSVVERIRAAGHILPVIALTGQGDEYVAARLMQSGADDYIVKADLTPSVLARSMDYAEVRYRERLAQRELAKQCAAIRRLSANLAEANLQLSMASRYDPLTRVFNRSAWRESMDIEHNRATRRGHHYGVVLLDIDFFKGYNDSLGHQAGDDCLVQVARTLFENVRSMDFVARYGGEEFIILAPETQQPEVIALARRVCAAVRDLNIIHPNSSVADHVTVSAGVGCGPQDRWEDVVRQADEALYAAKNAGRNRVHPAMTEPAVESAYTDRGGHLDP